MKTIVEIEWDEPQEQNWLCADNIALALSAYCTNTKFNVTSLDGKVITEDAGMELAQSAVQTSGLLEIACRLLDNISDRDTLQWQAALAVFAASMKAAACAGKDGVK